MERTYTIDRIEECLIMNANISLNTIPNYNPVFLPPSWPSPRHLHVIAKSSISFLSL